jgi:hypothetical protein
MMLTVEHRLVADKEFWHDYVMEGYLPESDFLCSIFNEEVSFEGDFGARNLALLIAMLDDAIDANRDWAAHFLASCDHDSSAIRAGLFKAANDMHSGTRFEAIRGLAKRNAEGVETLVLDALTGEEVGDVLFEAAGFVASAALLPALESIQLWWELNDDDLKRAIEACKTGISARY